MTYVLIVLAYYGGSISGYATGFGDGVQVSMQEFSSKETCEAARSALVFPKGDRKKSHNSIEDMSPSLKTFCLTK